MRVDAATPRRAETMGRKRQNKPSPRDQLGMELERRLGPGRLELELWSFRCGFGSLFIQEDAVANDKRILAHVSREEARTYIRGVNAHHEKGTRRYRLLMRGCLACFLLGAALFGTLMGVFREEPRIRCEGRLCEPGEDPLVDGCCVFWCCGEKNGRNNGRWQNHELPARPYNTSWDVWSDETYLGIDERCSLYDDGDEHRPEDHTPRDANYECGSCPATNYGCRTMFEGNAKEYEVTWPLLFLIPYLLPIPFLIALICASACAVPRLYEEAFADWRDRGVLICVEIKFQAPHAIDATWPLLTGCLPHRSSPT